MFSTPVANLDPKSNATSLGILNSDVANRIPVTNSSIRSISLAGQDQIGPQSQFEVVIPQSSLGFIKPNSMYLRFTFTLQSDITQQWAFAGQSETQGMGAGNNYTSPSPASACFETIRVVFPNGAIMEYTNNDIYTWGILLSHVLPQSYCKTDLKMLMHCHTVREGNTSNPTSWVARICVPLDIPIFNAAAAFPLCLLNGPIRLQFFTTPTTRAVTTSISNALGYNISRVSLVYDEIQVSSQFKTAFVASIQQRPFSIAIKDRAMVGFCDGSKTQRIHVGINVSSLTGVVAVNPRLRTSLGAYTSTLTKACLVSGLVRWSVYADHRKLNPMELDDDAVCFAELSRALCGIYDINRGDNVADLGTNVADARRTTFNAGQFAVGFSTTVLNDAAFALRGIPVQNLAVEFERSPTTDATLFPRNGIIPFSTSFVWIFYDAVCTVDAAGNVALMK